MRYLTCASLHIALEEAIEQARQAGQLDWLPEQQPTFWVKRSQRGGDFASNVAFVMAAQSSVTSASNTPRGVAEILQSYLQRIIPEADAGLGIEEAKGFLNFRLDDQLLAEHIERAIREGARYGAGGTLAGTRINVEFVSADPTGPLTFSSGRMAAAGETLCRILEFQGAVVTREFYLNDIETSSKMRLLGESVAAFYLSAFERDIEWPEGALQDAFVRGVAEEVIRREGNNYLLVPDGERAAAFAHEARETAVTLQKRTLQEFGIRFDVWTSESVLSGEGRVGNTLNRLKELGHTYERDGALWLRTSTFGDENDRPLVRANGQPTYLTSDIAYHVLKMERGFDIVLNVWTAQHRQYVLRTRAALQASHCDPNRLEVLLCESARYLDDGTVVARGKGGGPFTLGEALRELGRDTLRLEFLKGDWEDVIEIEAEVARRDNESNSAYAARLLPTRLRTMIGELEARASETRPVDQSLSSTLSEEERELARLVALWPDTVDTAARRREPQRIAQFIHDMATATRTLLAASRPDTTNGAGSTSRLQLLRAAQITAANALGLLGIEADARV